MAAGLGVAVGGETGRVASGWRDGKGSNMSTVWIGMRTWLVSRDTIPHPHPNPGRAVRQGWEGEVGVSASEARVRVNEGGEDE